MKAKYIFLPFIIVCTTGLLFSSCQKDISAENGILPGANAPAHNALGDSNYLSKVTYIEFRSGVADTSIRRFIFDSQKRVHSVSDRGQNYFDSTSFFYNGTDTLPFKSISTSYDGPETDTLTDYFYYNSSSLLVKDSLISAEHHSPAASDYSILKTMRINTYNGTMIYRDEQTAVLDDPGSSVSPINYKDTFTLDAYRNVIGRSAEALEAGAPPVLTVNHITYDNKSSPYIMLNINYLFPIEPGEVDLTSSQLGSKNNRFTWSEELFFNGVSAGTVYNEDLSGLYTYKPSGVPSLLFVPYPGSTDYDKSIFEYISL